MLCALRKNMNTQLISHCDDEYGTCRNLTKSFAASKVHPRTVSLDRIYRATKLASIPNWHEEGTHHPSRYIPDREQLTLHYASGYTAISEL